jgi:CheY-like chemotaxis protein
VFSFSSGEECFAHYHSLDPEIFILDYKLAETFGKDQMNGLDVLRKVKSVKPETEIIFLSGQESFEVATAAIKDGAAEYIVKDDRALPKMLNEVNRMSMFIRTRREELRTLRWTIALTGIVAVLLIFAYYTGYEKFSGILNLLIIAASCACLVFLGLMFRRKKREHLNSREKPETDERPGDWLD